MDIYSILIAVYVLVAIVGIAKGVGESRTVIIFKNYDDLGLTFLIPASFLGILYLFVMLGGSQMIAYITGGLVATWLLIKLIQNTYNYNGQNMPKTILALLTKIPLSIIWVFNLIQVLNPSGRTRSQRRSNRGQALVILVILTPIIGLLVVDREGSYFNPRNWLKGTRTSGIRNHL